MTRISDGVIDRVYEFAAAMRRTAATGTFDGRETSENAAYLAQCRQLHRVTNTLLIFTRDTGHHTSGWFKNPDYERCLHLSTSPAPRALWTPGAHELDRDVRDLWLRAFFGDDIRRLWAESPKSDMGKRAGVWHWRLFCDSHWRAVLPRGEVYSNELTEIGWKSASELGVRIATAAGMDPS